MNEPESFLSDGSAAAVIVESAKSFDSHPS